MAAAPGEAAAGTGAGPGPGPGPGRRRSRGRKGGQGAKERRAERRGQPPPASAGSPGRTHSGGGRSRSEAVPGSYGWKARFAAYLDGEALNAALERGDVHRCEFRVNRQKRAEGYCTLPGLPCDVLVDGFRAQNRAVAGDVVGLRLHPVAEWKPLDGGGRAGPAEAVETSASGEGGEGCEAEEAEEGNGGSGGSMLDFVVKKMGAAGLGPAAAAAGGPAALEAVARLVAETGKRPTGTVVALFQRSPKRKHLVGFLSRTQGEDAPMKRGEMLQFVPVDKGMPKLLMNSRDVASDYLPGGKPDPSLLLKARLVSWEPHHPLPGGEVDGILGDAKLIATQTAAILYQEGLFETHGGDFPEAALACLPGEGWRITDEEVAKRRDLRGRRVFSIDPPTARDLDDALSVARLGDGLVEVGVHIADVAHFVHHGTELDREAAKRATSVYLVQKVLPMLPRLLCEQLCSLHAGVDRLAFSVVWVMAEADCSIRDQWIGKTVIRSCAKLHYGHAQQVIDGRPGPLEPAPEYFNGEAEADVKEDVRILHGLAQKMRAQRFANGSLSLDNAKLSFEFDDTGHPTAASVYQQRESNRLVEEFMLLANRSVAQAIAGANPTCAVLRRHPPPDEKKLKEAVAAVERLGGALDPASSGSMHRSLQGVMRAVGPEVGKAIMLMCTKPMQLALYFCTGDPAYADARELWGHYALACPRYTHFTSPIRRYPDLLVHRVLFDALGPDGRPKPGLPRAPDAAMARLGEEAVEHCKVCNTQKLAAKNASDNSQRLYFSLLLKDAPAPATGLVMSVNGPKWFDIFVLEFGLEARVWVEDMRGVEGAFDPDRRVLTLRPAAGAGPGGPRREADRYDVGAGVLPLAVKLMAKLKVVLHAREDAHGRRIDVAARIVAPAQ